LIVSVSFLFHLLIGLKRRRPFSIRGEQVGVNHHNSNKIKTTTTTTTAGASAAATTMANHAASIWSVWSISADCPFLK